MFTVSPEHATVPAGESVEVTVTADTRVQSGTGMFQGALVGTDTTTGTSVRVPLTITKATPTHNLNVKVIDRERNPAEPPAPAPLTITKPPPPHNLNVKVIAREGNPAASYWTDITSLDGSVYRFVYHPSGPGPAGRAPGRPAGVAA